MGRLASRGRPRMRLIFPVGAVGRKRRPSNGKRNLLLIGYSPQWTPARALSGIVTGQPVCRPVKATGITRPD